MHQMRFKKPLYTLKLLSFSNLCLYILFSSCSIKPEKNSNATADNTVFDSQKNNIDQIPDEKPIDPDKPNECSPAKIEVSYLSVKPILEEYCVFCHTENNAAGGVNFEGTYSNLSSAQWLTAINSVQQRRMPPSGLDLDSESKLKLSAWKDANFPESPTLIDNPSCDDIIDPPTPPEDTSINLISCDQSQANLIKKRAIRLTNTQYKNSIASIFNNQITSPDFTELPIDQNVNGFNNFSDVLNFSSRRYDIYRKIARAIAVEANQKINSGNRFGDLLVACDISTQANRHTCNKLHLKAIAERAFRRPLTMAQQSNIENIYNDTNNRNDGSPFFNAAEYIFLNDAFLYRQELGDTNGQLSSFELAESISYILTNSPPDAELRIKAKDGTLSSPAVLSAQIARLLGTDLGKTFLSRFIISYFELENLPLSEKPAELMELYGQNILNQMLTEIRMFSDFIFQSNSPTLTELITSKQTFVNRNLARIYDISGVTTNTFTSATLDSAQRSGLFTRAGFISNFSDGPKTSIFRRGAALREKLLCQTMAAPPDNVPALPDLDENSLSNREIIEIHTNSNVVCKSCHEKINDLGFAYGSYNDFGVKNALSYYGSDQGFLKYTQDINGEFTNAIVLNNKFATSSHVSDCFALSMFSVSYAKEADSSNMCEVESFANQFFQDKDIKNLIKNILTSNYFKARR
ncbi:MAG: DUF1592 domain-containing protein [Oligoflexales bacterium]|nr:DUF1592 domain-containing protein [Oligoflexales bacterium]